MSTRHVSWIVTAALLAVLTGCHEPSRSSDGPAPSPIGLEDIASYPRPGQAIPTKLAFSPDDRYVTCLYSPEGTLSQSLYAFDTVTGERHLVGAPPDGGDTEEKLSREEKLRRERQRERHVGITRYRWAKDADRMVVPLNGDIYVVDGVDGALRRVHEAGSKPALDPWLSEDGSLVAWVQDAELYVADATPEGAASAPLQVTSGARGTGRTNGLAEYIAQEEMDRDHGFWWSPDGSRLAFVQADETHIPRYRIMHQGKGETGPAAEEDHRYPFPGAANARVRLGVVGAAGGRVVWMDLGEDDDIYLARVAWLPDGRLSAQRLNREQSVLELIFFDAASGEARVVVREETDVWINLHHMFHPLEKTEGEARGGFVWASERSGFRHLQLHDSQGRLLRPLTEGEWVVDALIEVDEVAGKVTFTASKDGVLERHLYEVGLSGGEPRRITAEPGWHKVTIDHGHRRFIDVHDALDQPPSVVLKSLADGRTIAELHAERDPALDRLKLAPPRLVSLTSRDGVLLHGALFEPPSGSPPWPTLLSVYGGPHGQTVKNSWHLTADLRTQYLRSQGYLVFKLDNRGSARRGLAFEGALQHDMGNIELRDQVDGVNWLTAQGLADPQRVGIYGWSYGGYLAAMAIARAPEVFSLAVAGAPVTHWDGYDTCYTERYMGTPQSNPEGYERSSIMHHVEGVRGRLLLVHGLLDENVHFRHTARLIDALITHKKDHEVLLFPDERHMPRRLEDRVYMERRVFAFIQAGL